LVVDCIWTRTLGIKKTFRIINYSFCKLIMLYLKPFFQVNLGIWYRLYFIWKRKKEKKKKKGSLELNSVCLACELHIYQTVHSDKSFAVLWWNSNVGKRAPLSSTQILTPLTSVLRSKYQSMLKDYVSFIEVGFMVSVCGWR